MAIYNKSNFKSLYGLLSSIFADNTTGNISEGDLRQSMEDIADSLVFSTSGALVLVGDADLSTNLFPASGGTGGGGSILKGNTFRVTVGGTPTGTGGIDPYAQITALTDAPGQDITKWWIRP